MAEIPQPSSMLFHPRELKSTDSRIRAIIDGGSCLRTGILRALDSDEQPQLPLHAALPAEPPATILTVSSS